jgi:arginase
MIDLIGVPFDLCGRQSGSRLGPEAIRLANLVQKLRSLGLEVCDRGDLTRQQEKTAPGGIRNFEPFYSCATELNEAVQRSMREGSIPLVLGGDHSIAFGSVSGALAVHQDTTLLWIDAHADLNTPSSSPSGNLHGMPIAALWGLPSGFPDGSRTDKEWSKLTDLVSQAPLTPSRTSWLGLRDVDPAEAQRIKAEPTDYTVTMQDIDKIGIVKMLEIFDAWMNKSSSKHLWISFDVDVLDPVYAPGTGTAVTGGLSYREAHLMAETLRERLNQPECTYKLIGLDVVETSPIVDQHNSTARMASEWVASLFGKTILG